MSRSTRALSPARRDAGLRRLRVVNRMLIGAAVLGTGLLADVAANAFPGHKRPVKAGSGAAAAATTTARTAHRGRHRGGRRPHGHAHARAHAPRHRLTPPTAAPAPAPTTPAAPVTPATPTAPAPAPEPAAPATAAPAPAPAAQARPGPGPGAGRLRRLLMPALADPSSELRTITWPALGTTVLVRHAGPDAPEIRAAVERELADIDAAASRFRPDSELVRLNRAGGAWTLVSPLLHEAVALAVRAAEASGGAVDPTLGASLIDAGYDRDWLELEAVRAEAPFPPAERIVVRRRREDLWRAIELSDDPDRPAVRVPPGVRLDLGSTAKALAADRAAAAAHAAGDLGDAGVLVALGGDIATCGPAPAGGWLVHVTDDHRSGPDAPGQTISIRSGGLATSSLVTRRWRHEGRDMHHVLDPRDGRPVRSPWRTVSVAAGTCADANIASTAAIVLGDQAPGWLAEHGLPARLVELDGTAHVQGGWPA